MESLPDLEEQFEAASNHLPSLVSKLDQDDLLYFYARFKQAKVGPCNVEKPSFFNFQAKHKWNAWNGLGQMDSTQAMEEYVEKMSAVDPGWQEKESKPVGSGWVSVSSMAKEEDDLEDSSKTVIDWIKEGNVEMVEQNLKLAAGADDESVAKELDDNGLGLIHWAADRGFVQCLELLKMLPGFDVNLPDSDGQTALHYACSNGHLEVAKSLLDIEGIDTKFLDCDGMTPQDVIDPKDAEILALFAR